MRYEFRLAGLVPEALADTLSELHADQTLFSGSVTDEAHLYKLLCRFQTLGLDVLDMRQLHESRARHHSSNVIPAPIPE